MSFPIYSLLALVAYVVYGAYWRLYLSPIAHIPGPKLAALTRLYEAYYDLFLGGQYTFKIISLHKKYGPIIRISPWEIHVSDPDFYDTIYASSASRHKRDKYEWFTKSFGLDNSVFGTASHDIHKMRRAALNPYFSMASVRRLQPVIRDRVDVLLERFRGFRDTGSVVMASWAFAAFTNDVVMTYSFARCDNRLEAPDFDPSYRDASFFGSTAGSFLKHAPWVNNLMQSLPDSVARLLHPAMASFIAQKRNTLTQISELTVGKDDSHLPDAHPTIFHSILSSNLPESEKSITRLSDDAQVLMMAGTLTTAWVLEITTYWLLSQPKTLFKLKSELTVAIPDPTNIGKIPLPVLEQLPYLNAVIKEALRLSYGVSCRLARISPDESMTFVDRDTKEEWHIPAGTPVGMTSVQIHHYESIFPDSKLFFPERWLESTTSSSNTYVLNKHLDKYIMSFGGGSRKCMGIDLAYAELYLCLSALWRVWGSMEGSHGGCRGADDVGVFELYETGLRDVEIESDEFLPIQQKGTKGIRIIAYS